MWSALPSILCFELSCHVVFVLSCDSVWPCALCYNSTLVSACVLFSPILCSALIRLCIYTFLGLCLIVQSYTFLKVSCFLCFLTFVSPGSFLCLSLRCWLWIIRPWCRLLVIWLLPGTLTMIIGQLSVEHMLTFTHITSVFKSYRNLSSALTDLCKLRNFKFKTLRRTQIHLIHFVIL